MSAAILGQMTAKQYTGKNASDLASAVGTAVSGYIVTPNLVSCTLSGVAGPLGNIQSVAVAGIEPNSMSTLMYTRALNKNISGRDIGGLFSAVSTGIVQILQGLVLTGTAIGIATGGGTGFFTAVNEKTLSGLIFAQMTLRQMTGKNARDLSDCISYGVVTQLKTTAKVTVVSAGTIAPVAPTGPVAVTGIPSATTSIS
ncbi:MAG: hypothetical protein GF334_00925 [Candidatus Altiarchaeales archaeon]|nr:hypothetical protein [Candidatus Altiarchaeales archaeon]